MINNYNFFCKEYQAVVAQAISAGYTFPSVKQRWLQNNLFKKLIAAHSGGISDIYFLRCYANDALDGTNLGFSGIDWKTPGSNVPTGVNSPSKISNAGYQSDGSTSYINEGFLPENVVPSNSDVYYAVYYIGSTGSTGRCGKSEGSSNGSMVIQPYNSTGPNYVRAQIFSTIANYTSDPGSLQALREVSRVDTSNVVISSNGTQLSTSAIASTSDGVNNMHSLCQDNSGSKILFMPNSVQLAFKIIGKKSTANTATVAAAMAEYLAAL